MAVPVRRGDGSRRGIGRAGGVVLLLCVAATLSAFAPADAPGGRDAGSRAIARAATPLSGPGGSDTTPDAVSGAAGDTAGGASQRPAAGEAPRAATPRPAVTMSMDTPIQGGLTARQAQAASAAVLAAHDAPATAPARGTWTPAMGRTAAARARSWLGMPYSWAGGTGSGPTAGRCDPGAGADLDCRIVGFDCSGLVMYAWGPYAALPHFAQTQREAGFFHPSLSQLRAGDLVFFSGYIPEGIGHVAVYEGDGMVIEAPQSGGVVQRSPLRELLADNGVYRGAVRPLTPQAPELTGGGTIASRGATVTLRGTHLAGVTSLTVGPHTITRFSEQTDSTLRFRVPATAPGPVTVVARTPWGAAAEPVRLTVVRPVTAKPAPPKASTPKPSTPAPVSTPPKTVPPKPTPPKSSTPPKSPPKSTPVPTPTAPTTTAPASIAPAIASTSGP